MGVFDKAKDFIHSEEVEEKSDAVLDKAEGLATEKLGADKADTIAKVRNTIDDKSNTIDDKIGNEGNSWSSTRLSGRARASSAPVRSPASAGRARRRRLGVTT